MVPAASKPLGNTCTKQSALKREPASTSAQAASCKCCPAARWQRRAGPPPIKFGEIRRQTANVWHVWLPFPTFQRPGRYPAFQRSRRCVHCAVQHALYFVFSATTSPCRAFSGSRATPQLLYYVVFPATKSPCHTNAQCLVIAKQPFQRHDRYTDFSAVVAMLFRCCSDVFVRCGLCAVPVVFRRCLGGLGSCMAYGLLHGHAAHVVLTLRHSQCYSKRKGHRYNNLVAM